MATEVVKAIEIIETAEVIRPKKSLLRTSESSSQRFSKKNVSNNAEVVKSDSAPLLFGSTWLPCS